MPEVVLSPAQLAVINRPAGARVFLSGPPGAGKTTAAVARLAGLLDEGVSGNSILVLTPQRTLAAPYLERLRRPGAPPGREVDVLTLGGLAQRMVALFWPLVAGPAGFAEPDRPPVFLTLETAQYYMARLVRPKLDKGYFESVAIDRNRLLSQVLDNLNKAAVVGFPHTEIATRLKSAWSGASSQARVYDEAQEVAEAFRAYCLAHSLLDFSLQYELFVRYAWPQADCRRYLTSRYRHLIADNVEEDTPVAHDLLLDWLPACRSALVIYDTDGGYRRFLGADPVSALRLSHVCTEQLALERSLVTPPSVRALAASLRRALNRPAEKAAGSPLEALHLTVHRFHPEMLDWVADQASELVHQGHVPPQEIAILAPFLDSALRFSLQARLEQRDVPTRSHRPSRALREEPAARALLTLAALCHPEWGICPPRPDVALALALTIDELDLCRAHLLAEIAYRTTDGKPGLTSFERIEGETKQRITYLLGGRFDSLRVWIQDYVAQAVRRPERRTHLDHFLSRLFGELLSQRGFGFHGDFDAGEVTANLIESARKFRQVMIQEQTGEGESSAGSLASEYVEMVDDGVVAAQHMRSWQDGDEDAVLLAPAHTFLMRNRPVTHQFWLDVGGTGWWERLYQPLTHPYVLSRSWPIGQLWTDADEFDVRTGALADLLLGLLGRCRGQVHLGISEMGPHGTDQRGPLLQALQQVLRNASDPASQAERAAAREGLPDV